MGGVSQKFLLCNFSITSSPPTRKIHAQDITKLPSETFWSFTECFVRQEKRGFAVPENGWRSSGPEFCVDWLIKIPASG